MDARRMRKALFRRTIDYNTSVLNYLNKCIWQNDFRDDWAIQPDYLYQAQLEPPIGLDNPINCVTTKHVRTSTNKNKCPIYCVCWTPEGRRLITGAFSGEFTLWNGLTFNFETILQAHESQIRCMKWSYNEDWLLTADHAGYVKYWQANMNNVEMFQAHKEPIRGVSFSPSDDKFVSCSDDSTVRIWDFYTCTEERVLRGHGADVRCVAWHPHKSLIISGSKDAQQPIKLWEPKTGESIATLYVHKNTCTDVMWNKNGNFFLTASRDHLIKLFDIRQLKTDVQTFRGHKRDVMRVAWHPIYESLFASGSADGAIMYWLVGSDIEVGSVDDAHENMIWSLAWHPLGHILVSGANDFATKFWTRNRPGDILKETSGSMGSGLNRSSNTIADDDQHMTESMLDMDEENDNFVNTNDDPEATLAEEHSTSLTIPGLLEGAVQDLNEEDESQDKDKTKGHASKTIPKQFVQNWASAKLALSPMAPPRPPMSMGDNMPPMNRMMGPPRGPERPPMGPPEMMGFRMRGPRPHPGHPDMHPHMQHGRFPFNPADQQMAPNGFSQESNDMARPVRPPFDPNYSGRPQLQKNQEAPHSNQYPHLPPHQMEQPEDDDDDDEYADMKLEPNENYSYPEQHPAARPPHPMNRPNYPPRFMSGPRHGPPGMHPRGPPMHHPRHRGAPPFQGEYPGEHGPPNTKRPRLPMHNRGPPPPGWRGPPHHGPRQGPPQMQRPGHFSRGHPPPVRSGWS